MAKLCLLNETGQAIAEWYIADRPLVVGRSPAVTVQVRDDGISRRHFLIEKSGSHYVLRDLSSRNGTWVGGEREYHRSLRNDDRIIAGRSEFRFCAGSPATETRVSPSRPSPLPESDESRYQPVGHPAVHFPSAWE